MPELRIQFMKRPDGSTVLTCTRADGSVTWQRSDGRTAVFFPMHDLTHYAVETVLRARHGFFGLVADGWSIEDTSGKGGRGPLPAQAIAVEHIVGFLDVERATGSELRAEEFTEQLSLAGVEPVSVAAVALTDDNLAHVRTRRRELFAQWAAVGPGEALELPFDRSSPVLA